MRDRLPAACLAVFLLAAALSAIGPSSYFNWVSETFPAWAGAGVLVATHRRFPLTPIVYALLTVFCVILFVGGHYTYAEVPLGEWMKGWFGLQRNHFDRIGHFFQGVVPAMIVRESLLRRSPLRPGPRLFLLCCASALAISALYELFEWQYAVIFGGDAASDFLGSQGDPWDAQQDMAMALFGSIVSQAALGGWHGRQIKRLTAASRGQPE